MHKLYERIIVIFLQWRRGANTHCRSTMQARQQGNSSEDNWVATQFISRSTAQPPSYDLPIFVNVTYKFLTCNPRRFGLYYYPSASEPSSSSKQDTSNYIHIENVTATNGNEQTESFSFNLGSQFGGFYLAFRDQDSCGSVNRVQVYRGTCPQRTEGLVIYPETPAGIAAVSVTHQCAANANVSGSGLMCNPDGPWSGSPSCSCVPGYRAVTTTCQGTNTRMNNVLLINFLCKCFFACLKASGLGLLILLNLMMQDLILLWL